MTSGKLKKPFHSPSPSPDEVHAFVNAPVGEDIAYLTKFLDQYPAFIDASITGWTALLIAVIKGRKDMVSLLLERGADFNAKNTCDWTPLMYAALHGHPDIARLLLKKGADINAKDNIGDTALTIAQKQDEEEVAAVLEQWPEKQQKARMAAEIAGFSPKLKRDLPALRPLRIARKTP